MALVSTSEYKAWRGVSGSDYDSTIAVLVPIAQRWVERVCGRTEGGFESDNAPFTEKLDGTGTQVIQVSNGPISSITSIKFGNGTQSTIDASTYSFQNRTIMRIPKRGGATLHIDDWGDTIPFGVRRPNFPDGFQNIEVVYTAGYASGSIPDDLKYVIYRLVDHYLESRGRDIEKQAEVLTTNYTLRPPEQLQSALLDLLRPWRDPL